MTLKERFAQRFPEFVRGFDDAAAANPEIMVSWDVSLDEMMLATSRISAIVHGVDWIEDYEWAFCSVVGTAQVCHKRGWVHLRADRVSLDANGYLYGRNVVQRLVEWTAKNGMEKTDDGH